MKYRNTRKSHIYIRGLPPIAPGDEFEFDGNPDAPGIVAVNGAAPTAKKKKEKDE